MAPGRINGPQPDNNGFVESSTGQNILGETNGLFNGTTANGNGVNGVRNLYLDHPPGNFEPIAIVGMGLRLPGGIHDSKSLWDFLVSKRDARMRVPANRFNIDGFYSPQQKPGSLGFDHGYFIDSDLEKSDAGFFTATKAEFEMIDPQQRLLLEVVYEAFQDAGEVNWRGKKIGCYAGVYGEDWHDLHTIDTQDSGMYRITGAGDFVLGNRVSYEYDLQGPSMTIKVGCSSTLVGLHLACEAIQRGDCSSAIVGGTNLIMSPFSTMAMIEHGALSPNASIKAFDASADGYARAEAINAIYIKKLDDAIRDGNPIRAVIRATASNCDGKTAGLSNPSSEAHEALMRTAYKAAGIQDFSETAMVECHGTGTPVGDPLEVNAVARVFGDKGVYIGSVKPNLGHSEGASGLTSLIKAVLSLEHKTIIPNIKFTTPNPKIPWEQARLTVPTEPMPWPKDRSDRISVNSFGLGGANAHVIVDSATKFQKPAATLQQTSSQTTPILLVFSANHPASLQNSIENFQSFLRDNSVSLRDVAYTLGARREHMLFKAFGIVSGRSFEASSVTKSNSSLVPAFVFTGQGAQWPEMGKDLMTHFETFRADIRKMDATLSQLKQAPTWKIEDELLKPQSSSSIDRAELSQPLCTAVQIGLINLLRNWGILPAAVVGHSSGEIAAAYTAGAFSSDIAIRLAYYRGFVTKSLKRHGAMAAIGLGCDEVASYLAPGVVVACVNSGNSVTISGDKDQVQQTILKIKAHNPDVLARELRVEIAYHSPHMQDVGALYQALVERDLPEGLHHPLTTALYSSVTKERIIDAGDLGATYWRQNLESPVLFHSAVKSLLSGQENTTCLLEVGPHSALAGPVRQIFKESGLTTLYASCLQRGTNCTTSLLKAIGQLHCNGAAVDFKAMNKGGITLPDLPTYSWHRENSYWRETRISKEYRSRRFPHHDLLGSRTLEGNDLEPVWRCTLHLNVLPWLQDHALHNDVVFPAAGFVVIVGEAIRQISGAEDYTIQRVTVSSALILQASKGTEVITRLQPHRLTNSLDSPWYEFSIISNSGAGWTRNCFGQVRAGSPLTHDVPELTQYTRRVSSSRWYQQMRKIGLMYGPAFRGLIDISAGIKDNTASARIVDQPRPGQSSYQFHPTSLDWVFQALSVAAHNGVPRRFDKMCLPAYIQELYVSTGGEKIHMNLHTQTIPGGAFAGFACGVSDGKVRFLLKGMKLTPFDDASTQVDEGSHGAVHLEWRPDIDFLEASSLLNPMEDIKEGHRTVEKLSLLCSIENMQAISSIRPSLDYLHTYRNWTEKRIATARRGENPLLSDVAELFNLDSSQRQAAIEDIMVNSQGQRSADPANAIYAVYKSIVGLYEGKVDILEVLYKDNVLTNLYNFLNADCHDFIQLLGHSKPNLKILEIGAGTGGLTALILEGLKTSYQERMYSKYTYTDISAGFFVAAKDRFQGFPGIEYAVLDISLDPIAQGFEAGTYDLIIASNTLHATPKLNTTLKHCRTLLHPQGRLFLQELCSESKWVNYIMGVLPGWWLGAADDRADEPYVFAERWDKELRDAGFAGVDTFYPDQEAPYQFDAHIIARPVRQSKTSKRVTLLVGSEISSQAREIETLFIKNDYAVTFCYLNQEFPFGDDIISLLDLDGPFLHDISDQNFSNFVQKMSALRSSGILWVTQAVQINCADPRYALIIGMARTIRSELGLAFSTLELDRFETDRWESVFTVFQKFQRREELSQTELNTDSEFSYSNGSIKIPRFHWISVPQELSRKLDTAAKGLWVGKPGLLQSLQWKPHDPVGLSAIDVEIEVRAGGLNFKDVLRALGIVSGVQPEENYLGQDCAGIIRRVGADVHHVKPGDRVIAWTIKAFSTQLITQGRVCIKIPDSLSFEEAATMASVYITAFESLQQVGRLEAGQASTTLVRARRADSPNIFQTLLIHSASGGVGYAAIQVAQMIGAEIYVTVGSEEKVTFIMETHGIPRDHIFHSRDESFKDDILRATNGKGVDLVLNSLSGELLHASWKCVAEYGLLVEIGKRDLIGEGHLAMDLFEANRGYHGVDVSKLCLERPAPTTKYLKRMIDYYEQGLIKPIQPMTVFDAADMHDAFRYMQKGQHMGKIVIRFPADPDTLPNALVPRRLELKPDVSYFLAGGLGGLGQAIAIWMADHGAKNLIFLSRSGGKNVDKSFFNELEELGCSAQVFSGDISDIEAVKNAVSKAAKPIAGVMQMSMVLRDRALAQMSFDDWQAAVVPKVPGTWNLHEALKKEKLDFFVLFSSGSGTIGQSGQANYASANTFQDAFVQYRQGLGLAASVMDIGVVEDVGYVSENPQVLESLRAAAFHLLSETDLLESLQLMIDRSPLPAPSTGSSPTDPYTNLGGLVLGLRTSLPLADPGNRCIWKRDPRMGAYRDAGHLSISTSSGTDEVLKRFLATAALDPASLATDACVDFLTEQISHLVLGFLMIPDGVLDMAATLNDIGIDSLVAIELRNWWRQNFGTDISVLELLNATVKQLGILAAERLREKIEGAAASANGDGIGAGGDVVGMGENEKGKVSGEEYLLMKSL